MALTAQEEEFAQAIVRGESATEAYGRLHPKATRKSATERGSKWSKRVNIASRIQKLREELQKASDKITIKAAEAAVKQLTCALLTPARKYEILAHIAETATDNREKMQAIKLDSELRGELVSRQDLTTDGAPLPQAMPQIVFATPTSFNARRGSGTN